MNSQRRRVRLDDTGLLPGVCTWDVSAASPSRLNVRRKAAESLPRYRARCRPDHQRAGQQQ